MTFLFLFPVDAVLSRDCVLAWQPPVRLCTRKQRRSVIVEIASTGLLWINKTYNIALYVTSSNAEQVVFEGVERDRERFSHW